MKTTENKLWNIINDLNDYYWNDQCGYEGVYLSDGVSMSPADYAWMTGTMSKKHTKIYDKTWDKLMNIQKETHETTVN